MRIRYAKSLRDLERSAAGSGEQQAGVLRSTVRTIRCVYETDAEAAQAVVPKPLEARLNPEVHLSFGSVVMEISDEMTLEIRTASFGVGVDYDSTPGVYLITMPMSSEQAVMGGRERFGEPKKLAAIEFDRARTEPAVEQAGAAGEGASTGDRIFANVERMGIVYMAATGRLVEELGPRERTEHAYCFKAFPSCDPSKGFDQDPQLVRLEWRHHDARAWRLEGGIELVDSAFDPVADLPVRRLAEFEYTEGTTLSSGRVLRPVPGDWLLPFIHQRYDAPDVQGVEV